MSSPRHGGDGESIPPAYEALKPAEVSELRREDESIPPAYEALKPLRKKWHDDPKRVDPARLRGIETRATRGSPWPLSCRSRPPTRH